MPATAETLSKRAAAPPYKKRKGMNNCNFCNDFDYLVSITSLSSCVNPMIIPASIIVSSPNFSLPIHFLFDTGARLCFGSRSIGKWLTSSGGVATPVAHSCCSPLGICVNIDYTISCNLRYFSEFFNGNKVINILLHIFNFENTSYDLVLGFEAIALHTVTLDFASKFRIPPTLSLQGDEGSGQPASNSPQLQANSPSSNLQHSVDTFSEFRNKSDASLRTMEMTLSGKTHLSPGHLLTTQ